VCLESDLSFNSHVKTESEYYYHLKNIARIRCFVSNQDLEKLVHAFITFRVDYCNGLPKKTIKQLQLIQNRGPENMNISHQPSHLYTGSQLHLGLILEVLLLVYKSFNGLGPQYFADMLTEYKRITLIIRITEARNPKG